jgi:uncharacterized protein
LKFVLAVLRPKEKKLLQLFKVNKEFSTRTKITKRTAAVGEAFGIGIDETKRFSVFKDFQVEVEPGQVVLITGDSGSGKSTLLQQICEQARLSGEFGEVVDNQSVEISDKEILIEGVGKDTTQAISILSMAGLNEAFLMLRKYCELSDGQKYRHRIAKMIDSAAGLWAFDEFAAVLDRTTAKVVAYTVQKTARQLGKTLVVATTHEDLLQDLKPDILIRKKFGDAVQVMQFPSAFFAKECTLVSDAKISRCSKEDVQDLEKFHYRGANGGVVRQVFKATLGEELAAAIIYVFPHPALRGRNKALPEFRGKQTSELLKKLNAQLARIARVIVAPKFRSIGLGAFIVKKTMPLTCFKYIETLAVMARYNPFFEKAGMTRVDLPENDSFKSDLARLEALGFRRELLGSKRENLKVISNLKQEELEYVRRFALKNCVNKKFRKVGLIPGVQGLEKEALAEALKNVKSNALYLYWRNPKIF